MQTEMGEQPAVLRRLLGRRDELTARVGGLLPSPLRGIVLVARGSSDNAAAHGRYLLERAAEVPVALAAPSLQTRYGVQPRLDGFLAIGVSQSGRTPEIVGTLETLGTGGAATLGITNLDGTPLGEVADATLLLDAGEEVAVPATKTFTAQTAMFCLVAEAIAGEHAVPAHGWGRAIDAVTQALDTPDAVEPLVAEIDATTRILPVGRGLSYAAALESGLKLAETTGLAVQGTSSADLRHGPIATVHDSTRAICFATAGPAAADVHEIAVELHRRGARVAAVTEDERLVPEADVVVPVLDEVPEALAILPQVVRGQQLALRTALELGVDPDEPFALSKVTPTR